MWFYRLDGKEHGPFSAIVVRELIASKELPANIMVSRGGMEDWQEAKLVEEIMEEPISTSAYSKNSPQSTQAELEFDSRQESQEYYKAFLGRRNLAYYLVVFEKRDRVGGLLGWNWPAFIFVFWWALYRKMYGRFFIIFGISVVANIATVGYPGAWPFLWLGIMIFSGASANTAYHSFVVHKIKQASLELEDKQLIIERLEKKGGVFGSLFWMAVLLLVVMIVGVIAAVALPAYQNYTNRAIFSELILSATSRKSAIELAIDLRELELSDIDGGTFGIPADTPVSAFTHGATVSDGVVTMTWMLDGTALSGTTYQLLLQNNSTPAQWSESGTCIVRGFC